MSRPVGEERVAFSVFKRQIDRRLYLRLAATELAVAAMLANQWPGSPARVVAIVLGSALVALSLHRLRMKRLLARLEASADNAIVGLSALTDLASEQERRGVLFDWLTLLVIAASLAIALLFLAI